MKKSYTVLLLSSVILLILIVVIGVKMIQKESKALYDEILGDWPEVVFIDDSISEEESAARRQQAHEEIIEENMQIREGKIHPETIDLGSVPGTHQYAEEKRQEEAREGIIENEFNENKYDFIYEEHEVLEESTEDMLIKNGIDIGEHGNSLWRNEYQGVLESISFVAVNDAVYYIFTYPSGPVTDTFDHITKDTVEYEKDAVFKLCGSRPVTLTIVFRTSDGLILHEVSN